MIDPLDAEVAILNGALELPPEKRAAYLDEACGDDRGLREQVEALLASHEQAGGFLEGSVVGPPPQGPLPYGRGSILSGGCKEGDRIGPYKLLQRIGEGGCGVVYMAEQEEPVRRRVALKVIRLGMDTESIIARFEAERQVLAMMDHPNIAKVLDAGATQTGRPYFVMELVRGIKITEYCEQNDLATQERLNLFVQVCRAIQHAHQKGIIHRDIKPSNILVTVNDGVAVPKVIDFGIAKATQGRLTDKTLFTAFEQFMGTPAYMSPEQAVMTSVDIDTRTDIYSLGVLLYELLTGRTPFDGKQLLAVGLDEMRRTIREAEPVKPSTRLTEVLRVADSRSGNCTSSRRRLQETIHLVRGDLDWIVMKCLEKDRARRYETANGLAQDVQRHLNHEPVGARPPSGVYRFRKTVRRNKTAFAAASAVLTVLIAGVIVSTSLAIRARHAERREATQRQQTQSATRGLRETVRLLELGRAEDFFRGRDAAAGVAHLAAILRGDPLNQIAADRLVSALVQRNWALPVFAPVRLLGPVSTVYFSPDGRHILTVSREATVNILDSETGLRIATVRHRDRIFGARFNQDGSRFVTASADGTARVWGTVDGEQALRTPLTHGGAVYWAEFSGDGKRVVTASADRTARIWDASNGELEGELRGHGSHVIMARFSPDGERVVTGGSHGSIRIWDIGSGETLFRVEDRRTNLTALAFSPDGRWLLSACADGVARVWSARDPTDAQALEHKGPIDHAAFSPDSRLVLTCSQDNTARLWDAETGQPVGSALVHEGGVIFGAFSPDGKAIVTTSMDNSARLWDVQTGAALCHPLRQYERILHADFSADGKRLVTGSYDWLVQVWDIRPRCWVASDIPSQTRATSVCFNPQGTVMLTTFPDGTAQIRNAQSGEPIGEPIRHSGRVHMGAFSADGGRFVTASTSRFTYVRDAMTGAVIAGPFQHTKGLYSAAFDPAGERLVTASADDTARVWSIRNGQPITQPLTHQADVRIAVFSPDGRLVATASDDHSARVWDAETGQPVGEPLLHADHVKWVEFSPDSTKVLSASTDNTACIWNARSGKRIAPPLRHARIVEKAVFSPDGQRIATASIDRTARIWDATTGQAMTPPLAHDDQVMEVSYSRNGQRILTACLNGGVRVWDSQTGRPLTEWLGVDAQVTTACFDPTGSRVGTAGTSVQVWTVPSAPTPVPEWFQLFTQAVAGIRLDERGNSELVSRTDLAEIAERLPPWGAGDFYESLARWFLSDPGKRPASPF